MTDFDFEPTIEQPKEPGIDFGQAFAFIPEDPRWIVKVSIIAGLTALATGFIVTPIALIALAALNLLPDEILRDLAMLYPQIANTRVTFTPQFYLLILPFAAGLYVVALLLGYFFSGLFILWGA